MQRREILIRLNGIMFCIFFCCQHGWCGTFDLRFQMKMFFDIFAFIAKIQNWTFPRLYVHWNKVHKYAPDQPKSMNSINREFKLKWNHRIEHYFAITIHKDLLKSQIQPLWYSNVNTRKYPSINPTFDTLNVDVSIILSCMRFFFFFFILNTSMRNISKFHANTA